MASSLFPQSPPCWKGCLLLLNPPLGEVSLKDLKKSKIQYFLPKNILPKEVVGFFEVRSDCVDFVDQIFNADNVVFAEGLSNDFVVGKGNSLLVDLSEASLVDQVRNSLSGGISVTQVIYLSPNN